MPCNIYIPLLCGDPGRNEVWQMLDDVIFADYTRADGLKMQVMTTCIDSGGHHTAEVYKYCKARESRRVWAIKGQGGSGIPLIKRPGKRNDAGVWLFNIGVDVGKDTMMSRLKVGFETEPGYCHFPIESDKGYDEQYFLSLTAEKRNIRTVNGRTVISWVKRVEGGRNEAWDIRNYNGAAIEILNPNMDLLFTRLNEQAKQKPVTIVPQTRRKRSKGVEIW